MVYDLLPPRQAGFFNYYTCGPLHTRILLTTGIFFCLDLQMMCYAKEIQT
jgi:hypothetical protein